MRRNPVNFNDKINFNKLSPNWPKTQQKNLKTSALLSVKLLHISTLAIRS